MTTICRICGNGQGNSLVRAREMMYGSGEGHRYFECARCGCLQISEIPVDVRSCYPDDYYSLSSEGRTRSWLRRERGASYAGSGSVIGSTLVRILPPPPFHTWLAMAGVNPHSSILDVGAGTGRLVSDMREAGVDAFGVDPFIECDVVDSCGGVLVKRAHLGDLEGQYEVVMFHHSLEHMPDQADALADASRLLRPGGVVIIRIPLVDSLAWRRYGVNWVQLDAPRHFYLHSRNSLVTLAAQGGFEIQRVVYDSTAFQFQGSERYRRAKALSPTTSIGELVARIGRLTPRYRRWSREAALLNELDLGDQAAFYLRRV